jgi:branched-chain amino acid transport system permease protein
VVEISITAEDRMASPATSLALLLVAATLGLIAVPMGLGPYGIRVATTLCMFIAAAQAWNLIGGYAGLMSLAHAAFIGTGAVAVAIFLLNGLPLWFAVPAAVFVTLVLAVIVGVPSLRLKGHYFVVATLLATEAVRNLMLNINAFNFDGAVAVNIISQVGLQDLNARQYNLVFFYVMASLAALFTLIVLVFEHSRWGLALRAMRDSERAASALGIASTRVKIWVFLLSAGLTALVGAAWACWLGTVETNEAYSLNFSFEIIVMVLLGGRGTVWGPLLGVIVVMLFNEGVGVEFAEVNLMISGGIVIAIVLFQPDGLARIFRDGWRAVSPAEVRANLRRYRIR